MNEVKGYTLVVVGLLLILTVGIGSLYYNPSTSTIDDVFVVERNLNADGLDRSAILLSDKPSIVTYDETLTKVRITDEETGDLLANPELTSDLAFSVIDRGEGVMQPVFRWKDNNTVKDLPFEAYLYGMELYSGSKFGSPIARDIDYYLKTDAGSRQAPIYGQECVSVKLDNGTQDQCTQTITSYRTELLYEWSKIEPNSFIPLGEFEIEARTDVKLGETVEWIPTFRTLDGRVEQWAVWTANLKQNLVRVWLFNESADKTVYQELIAESNGTKNGVDLTSGHPSKIVSTMNGSLHNSGAGSYRMDFPGDTGAFGDDNFTVMFDINTTSFVDANLFRLRAERTIDINTHFSSFDIRFEINGAGANIPSGTLSPNQWYRVFALYNSSGNHLIVDGNVTYSGAASGNPAGSGEAWNTFGGSQFGSNDGTWDNVYIWNRTLTTQEMQDLVNDGDVLIYDALAATPTITTVNLNVPANDTTITTNSQGFVANHTVEVGSVTNTTLYLWYLNSSLVTTAINSSIIQTNNRSYWNITSLPDATLLWNVLAETQNATATILTWSTNNNTLIIDTSAPVLNISTPNGTIGYGEPGIELDLNWSVSDSVAGLDTCFYEYNVSNFTVTCLDFNTTFIAQSAVNSLTFYANDTAGNSEAITTTWDYIIFNNEDIFNATTHDTSTESIAIDFNYTSADWVSITSNLIYDGTPEAGVASGTGDNLVFTNTRDIPIVQIAENVTFLWEFALTNTTGTFFINSTDNTQDVQPSNFSSCIAPLTIETINYTFYDEEDINTKVSVDVFDATFEWFLGTGTVKKNDSVSKPGITDALFCISPNQTFNIDSVIEVDKDGYEERTLTFNNQQVDGINFTEQKIYLINSSLSSDIIIEVTDAGFNPIPGITVQISRFYPSINDHILVTSDITDNFGQFVAKLVENEVRYKFEFFDNNNVLVKSIPDVVIACRASVCIVPFIIKDQVDLFNATRNISGFTYSVSFDNATNTFVYSWTDTTGETHTKRLFVERVGFNGTSVVCNTSSSADTGSVSCAVGNSLSTYKANAYRESAQDRIAVIWATVGEDYRIFGLEGFFWAFIILMTMLSVGIFSPMVGILLYLLGFFILGITRVISFDPTIFFAVMAVGGAYIWALTK